MGDNRPDAIGRFVWSLRHHWWLALSVFAAVLVVVVGLGPMVATGTTTYAAEALVVPRSLGEDLDALRLARFQQAVFDSGGVIEAAIAEDEVPYTSRRELLEHVELAPVEDNLALNVVASDPDPEVAAAVANVVATGLVDELNRVGASAGVFTVHTEAITPAEPEPRTSLAALVVIGVFGAVIAAAGVVGSYSALRRPALSPEDAAEVLDGPPLGRLRLPASREVPEPTTVLGLSSLVRRLYPGAADTCAFVSPDRDGGTQFQVARLVGRALARRGQVLYVTTEPPEQVRRQLRNERVQVRSGLDVASEDWGALPTVVEGPADAEFDLPQLLPGDAAVVVVVLEGTPSAKLQRLGQQFLPGEIHGVLYVQPERRRRASPSAPAFTSRGAEAADLGATGARDALPHG